MRQHLSIRDLASVLIVCIAWGGNFTAGARGMQHFAPFLFMVLRFSVLLLLLFPFLRAPPRGQWLRLIAVCLFIGALHFVTLFIALGHSADVSSVAIVLQSYIPMAVILAMLLLGEWAGWPTLLATFVAFIGVLIIGYDPMVLTQMDVLVLSLASALFLALGSIYQRGIVGITLLNFQAWTAVIALPAMLGGSLLFEQYQLESIRTASRIDISTFLYSALVASIVGHGLFFKLVQRHPVTLVMPYLQLTPVFAVLIGIFIWGDRPGWRLITGGAVVLLGILFITLHARRKSAVAVRAIGED